MQLYYLGVSGNNDELWVNCSLWKKSQFCEGKNCELLVNYSHLYLTGKIMIFNLKIMCEL